MNFDVLTIDFVRDLILRKETTAQALTEAFYQKIDSDDPKIHAYLTLSKERAFAKAAEIDGMFRSGKEWKGKRKRPKPALRLVSPTDQD